MASPLILRITSKFDPSGVKDAKSGFQDLSRSLEGTNRQLLTTGRSFDDMTASLAGVKIQGRNAVTPLTESFNVFHGAVRRVIVTLRTFRAAFFIGTIIAAPLILAAKRALELDEALKPLQSRLTSLGQAGAFETQRLLSFAETFQRTAGANAKDVLQSLDILVTKTRTAANAEQIIAAAQKIHLATGTKLVDVTKALADAFDGNAASLATLTGKTQQQINALLRSGELVRAIDDDFSAAAQRGVSSFSGQIEVAKNKIGSLFSDFPKLLSTALPFGAFINLAKRAEDTSKSVDILKKSIDNVLTARFNPDLRTFEELQIAAGKAADSVKQLQSILSDKNANITPKERADLEEILKIRIQEQGILEEQVARERELASSTRERLTVASELLALQTRLLVSQQRPRGRTESLQAFSEEQKQLRSQIQLQREAQIRLEALEEARQIFSKRGALTEEETTDILVRENNKLVQSRIEAANVEHAKAAETIDSLNKVKAAELALAKFQADNRRGKFDTASDADIADFEERAAKKQIALVISNAKKEREQLLSEGKLTAEEVQRLELDSQLKVEQIREDLAQRKAKREIELGKLSVEERKKQEEDAAKFRDTVDKFREGPRKLQSQIDFEIDTEKTLKKFRANLDVSAEKDKLKKDLGDLLTPEQKQSRAIFDALEASIRDKRLALHVNLIQDREQQQELANNLGTLISRAVLDAIKRQLSPLSVIQEIISGAAPGGSEQS